MKKLLFFPSLLFIFSLFFFSCSSKDEINEIETSKLSSDGLKIEPKHEIRLYTMEFNEFKDRLNSPTVYTTTTMGESAVLKATRNEKVDDLVYRRFEYPDLSKIIHNGKNLDNRARVALIIEPKYYTFEGARYEYISGYLKASEDKNYGGSYVTASTIKSDHSSSYIRLGEQYKSHSSNKLTTLWVSSISAYMVYKKMK